LVFLELRRGNAPAPIPEKLKLLDPSDDIGGAVVAALGDGV
jgi:hypothetical protein